MLPLATCAACAGFLPARSPRCPHCDAPSPHLRRAARVGRRLVQVATGGALAMTLMACYGGAPHHFPPPQPCPAGADADNDGSCKPDDCNDQDQSIQPNAYDVPGDGIDQDCDGQDAVMMPEGGTGPGDPGGEPDPDAGATSP